MSKKWLLSVGCAVVVLAGAGVFLLADRKPKHAGHGETYRRVIRQEKEKEIARHERRVRQNAQERVLREKPSFEIEDDEELSLTVEQKKLLAEIREAIDAEDKEKLVKLVQKLQASNEWPDGIPVAIRKAAIEALGWFGAGCLPEIAGFLGDGNEEVLEMANNEFEEALSDPDLSDFERAQIIKAASAVIVDDDSIDSMFMEFGNMRHSVAIETFIEIMDSGNDQAKEKLPECIEFYTGEEDLTTPEQLEEWLEINPDNEDDDEFYGRWDDGV